MAEKATMPTAPPSGPPPGGYPELPPSYDESVGAGGFVQPGPGGAAPKGSFQAAPPPPQMEPQQAGQQTVIVQYMNPPNFGPNPVNMTCPKCQSQIRTQTESEPGPLAWIIAGVLCVVGCWMCACIPCCIDSLNSVTHKCPLPQCKQFLGRYKGGM